VTANVTLGDRAFARNADKPASMVIVDCRVDRSARCGGNDLYFANGPHAALRRRILGPLAQLDEPATESPSADLKERRANDLGPLPQRRCSATHV
jgi:hypothetical protein